MKYNMQVSFETVEVIEFLNSKDVKTGKALYEQIKSTVTSKGGRIKCNYYSINTKKEFFKVLTRIENKLRSSGEVPLLHIETHGNENGLSNNDGQVVKWEETYEPLRKINHLTKVNLLVVMAACNGSFLRRILTPVHQAPVWGLIGPTCNVWDYDLMKGMSGFYNEIFTSYDLKKGLEMLNSLNMQDECEYILEPAELMFCKVYMDYMSTTTPEDIEQRIEITISKLKKTTHLSKAREVELYDRLRLEYNDHEKWYSKKKNRFMMLDQYPENSSRFDLTFQKCIKAYREKD